VTTKRGKPKDSSGGNKKRQKGKIAKKKGCGNRKKVEGESLTRKGGRTSPTPKKKKGPNCDVRGEENSKSTCFASHNASEGKGRPTKGKAKTRQKGKQA